MESKQSEKNEEIIEKINKELLQEDAIKSGKYKALQIIGNGSFGVVYKAKNELTEEIVAIKRVFQDRRYQNRELEILKLLKHPNTVTLKNYFYTFGAKKEDVFLNCVMEYSRDTLSKIIRTNYRNKQPMNSLLVKIFSYQMLKSLAYVHAIGICHRDIKPQNILIEENTNHLRLCDFGSAKKLIKGQNSIAYICSRYYRAPELIFGATQYTNQIDVWSMGCVIAELVLGRPLFPGASPSDQLVEIIKILGTPSKDDIFSMNPQYKDHKFPIIKPISWEKVFKGKKVDEGYLDLISKLVMYNPEKRLTPLKAMCHPFFEELRDIKRNEENKDINVPEGLFNFTQDEINSDKESCLFLINNYKNNTNNTNSTNTNNENNNNDNNK